MRSEGFPFIVGVWDWTCVCVVLVVSSSCCRRVGVASSSLLRRYFLCIRRYTRTATQSFPSKYEKWRKSRAKCSFWRSQVTKWEVVFAFCVTGAILKACQCKCVVFSWQAQHFVMWPFARSWQAQRFVLWRRCFFDKSHYQGRANVTPLQISWQVQHLVSILESGGSFAKVILVEFEGSLARNARFGASNFQKVRCHFRILPGRRKILEASCLKS